MDRKFEQVYNVDDYEILSEDGWRDIHSIGQTIEYEVWYIETQSGYYLRCADDHILFDKDGVEIFVKNCKPYETYIITEDGPDLVVKLSSTGFKENMYDLEVEGHKYYSNGILSHNTAFCAGYMLWYCLFNKGKTSGIVSNKESSAKEVLLRLANMYESVPSWLKCGVENYAKTHISFENGSRVIASATSKNSFRGWTINGLLLADEFAHVPRNLQEPFWSSNYPTISASRKAKMIIISTPLGMHDLFHETYTKAENKQNKFVPLDINWREHPERDDEWLEEQRDSLGPVLFRQEVLVEFLGSANTVIDADKLKELLTVSIDPIHVDLQGKLRIYEKPLAGATYVCGVDVAKGTGEHYSTIQVLRIDSMKPVQIEQVAVYENNEVDPYKFSEIINRVAIYYNDAYIMAENNSEGNTIVSELHWTYENEGLVNSGSKINSLGVRATTKTKPRAVILMKKFIEGNLIKLNDRETIKQLTDFVEKGNNRFKCDNLNDDLVSALYWACYFFKMDVLDEEISFKKDEEEDADLWGLLSDVDERSNEDWSWL